MESLQDNVRSLFIAHYGSEPAYLVRAPGRVNLIGEHTDYNDGFVMPMAIDRAVWIALHPRDDRQIVLLALNMDDNQLFQLDDFTNTDSGWVEYVKGVAGILQDEGYELQGWEGVVGGDVPIGAGLSSSAALELAAARAFSSVAQFEWDPVRMALLSQRAENDWVGMKCGIMDQMISAAGRAGYALLIDCRSLETRQVPLPADTCVVILDTMTRRGLVESAYNERREQCEEAAAFFGVPALRDVDMKTFEAKAQMMDELTMRRARHVISENERTLAAAAALLVNDSQQFGRLMDASHVSLRDDFEVSGPELDTMVRIAQAQPGCLGARMTGGGFAGCAVALVDVSHVEDFAHNVATAYAAETGLQPQLYVTNATDGASIVTDSVAGADS